MGHYLPPPPPPSSCFFMHPSTLLVMRTRNAPPPLPGMTSFMDGPFEVVFTMGTLLEGLAILKWAQQCFYPLKGGGHNMFYPFLRGGAQKVSDPRFPHFNPPPPPLPVINDRSLRKALCAPSVRNDRGIDPAPL